MLAGVASLSAAPVILAQVATNTGDDASSRLTLVIVGLLVLAVVIAAVTVVFWRLTRPSRIDGSPSMRWADRTSQAAPDDARERS